MSIFFYLYCHAFRSAENYLLSWRCFQHVGYIANLQSEFLGTFFATVMHICNIKIFRCEVITTVYTVCILSTLFIYGRVYQKYYLIFYALLSCNEITNDANYPIVKKNKVIVKLELLMNMLFTFTRLNNFTLKLQKRALNVWSVDWMFSYEYVFCLSSMSCNSLNRLNFAFI